MDRILPIKPTVFTALGDLTRLQIIEALRVSAASVGTLAQKLGVRQPQMSKHLKVLSESGLVKVTIEHRYRIYSLEPKGFESLAAWTESFEALWANRLSNLDSVLKEQNNKNQEGAELC